jgi:glycosyltransferase involved in cell wall biosynthesis
MSHLALFIPSLKGGGAEKVMVNLACGFADRGFQVDLLLIRAEGPYLAQIPPHVRIVSLGDRRLLLSFFALARYLQRERPQALLCGQEHINVVSLWLRRLTGVPTKVVVAVHNHVSRDSCYASELKVRLSPYLIRWFYPWADAVVAVSQGVAEDLTRIGLPKDSIQVIYNPVVSPQLYQKFRQPLDRPWFSPDRSPVILGVGRLEPQKDFSTLIRAFDRIRQQLPAQLVILGEGPERPALEALVRELQLTDAVVLPGFVSNPYAYMAAAAVCVLSSRWEGLGNVLIESMAGGTPVVSTDCPSGPAEILAGGRYGKLVPMQDPEALAKAIIDTLDRPPDRVLLQRRAQDFSAEQSISQYLQVLGTVR